MRPPLCTRGSRSLSPQPETGKCSIRLSATKSGGTKSAGAPSWSSSPAVLRPTAAIRSPAGLRPRLLPWSCRRSSTACTPLALEKTSQWNSFNSARASSRGPHSSGGPISKAGRSSTLAPCCSKSFRASPSCSRALVTTMVRPFRPGLPPAIMHSPHSVSPARSLDRARLWPGRLSPDC